MEYYAHSGESGGCEYWHRLATHLQDTGARAADFLEPAGMANIGRTAGLLHDLGKYTREFQARLNGGRRVNHSTAGAKVAIERYGQKLGRMLAFCVAGHHAGLADGVDGNRITALTDRLKEEVPRLDPVWEREIELPQLEPPPLKPRDIETAGFCAAFLIRMMFSALVDADYLDTEAYYAKLEGKHQPRGQYPLLRDISQRLDVYLKALMSDVKASEINDLRQEVLCHARSKADLPPGLFSLTVPTGGGKTLTSLAFALDHAVRHGLERIIYVIPYTSIIDQTASVFRCALSENKNDQVDFIIEHHSAFDEDNISNREAKEKLSLAMENWDAPIIVTTSVQFFESLFANRSSRCRKLHNITNSVVILDEAQTLPLKFLRPCVTALDELARNWRTSIVLCTATQPALRTAEDEFHGGLTGLREIAPDPKRLYQRLRRTCIHQQGYMDDTQLATRLREFPQALCIVNKRRHARELYESIRDAEGAAHLTTLMCAHHRREILNTVKRHLKDGAPVRLVATSLIEAGVDVDFPVVWRAEAGLESIIQAAGRCNREGKASIGDVFVFKPAEGEGRKPPGDIPQLAGAAREVMRLHEDPASLDAIRAYFQLVYWTKDKQLDAEDILAKIHERSDTLDFPFETIARKFRLIETEMVPIIIPYPVENDNGVVRCLLEKLERAEYTGRIARRLQPYTVQVPRDVRNKLCSAGAVRVVRKECFAEQFAVLENFELYSSEVGLTWDEPEFRRSEGLVY